MQKGLESRASKVFQDSGLRVTYLSGLTRSLVWFFFGCVSGNLSAFITLNPKPGLRAFYRRCTGKRDLATKQFRVSWPFEVSMRPGLHDEKRNIFFFVSGILVSLAGPFVELMLHTTQEPAIEMTELVGPAGFEGKLRNSMELQPDVSIQEPLGSK